MNEQVSILLDLSTRSDVITQKYYQERKLIRLITQHSTVYSKLVGDDLPFIMQILRTTDCFPELFIPQFKGNGMFRILTCTFTIPENWKKHRQVALFMAKRGLFFKQMQFKQFKNDKEIVLEACSNNPDYISDFPLGSDREFMKELCKLNGTMLSHASEEIKKDKEVVLTAIRSKYEAFGYCNELLAMDNTVICEAAKHQSFNVQRLDREVFKRRKLVLEVMKYHPELFIYLSDELRSDSKVLKLAPFKGNRVVNLAPPSYQIDRDFVMKCMRNNGLDLEYAHPSLRKDKEIVMEAVKQNGLALEFANETIRNLDREIILEAIKNSGRAIEFTSDEFKRDLELAIIAVDKDIESFHHLDISIKHDKHILSILLNKRNYLNYYQMLELKEVFYDTIRGDRDLLSLAVLKSDEFLQEPVPDFVDEDFILNAVMNGLSLENIPQPFKSNEEIILESIKRTSSNFKYIDPELANKKDFILKCIMVSGYVLSYIDDKFRGDRDVILGALKANETFSFEWNGDHPFNSDREILLAGLKRNGNMSTNANPEVINDPEFIVECVAIGKEYNQDINNYLEMVRDTILSNKSLFLKLVKMNPKVLDALDVDLDFITLAFNNQP